MAFDVPPAGYPANRHSTEAAEKEVIFRSLRDCDIWTVFSDNMKAVHFFISQTFDSGTVSVLGAISPVLAQLS